MESYESKFIVQNQFGIQPSEQQFTYNGVELSNMECILKCGIKVGEQIILSSSQPLVKITTHYGKEQLQIEVKPTATILGIKNLLSTVVILHLSFIQKSKKPIDVKQLICVYEDREIKDTTMISSLSQVESKILFFTYPELQLHIHLMDNQVSTIIKAYYCTMGKLREAIAV